MKKNWKDRIIEFKLWGRILIRYLGKYFHSLKFGQEDRKLSNTKTYSNRRGRKNKCSNSILNLADRVCTTVQPIYHEDIRIVNIGLCFFSLFFFFFFYFILFTISLELGFNSHMITIEDSRTIMLYSMFYIY